MSAPAFTPAPWHVETIDDGENDGVPIYGVCHAGTVCDSITVCNVLVEADAALISAAPELYAALEHVLTGALSLPRFASAEGWAAIAKARGEQVPA